MEKKQSRVMFIKVIICVALFGALGQIVGGCISGYLPIFLQAGNPIFAENNPYALNGFGLGAGLVGLFMSLTTLLPFILGPFLGAMSDHTKSRKRVIGITGLFTSLLLALMPFTFQSITSTTNGNTSALLIPLIGLIILSMTALLFLTISGLFISGLAYSITPREHMNKLGGVSAVFGGIGYVLTAFLGNVLFSVNTGYPFWIAAGFALFTVICTLLLLSDDNSKKEKKEQEKSLGPIASLKYMMTETSKDQKMGILWANVIYVCGNVGLIGFQIFGISWAFSEFKIPAGLAAQIAVVFYIAYIVSSIPLSILADKIGSRKVLFIGMINVITGALALIFLATSYFNVLLIIAYLAIGNAIFDSCFVALAQTFGSGTKLTGSINAVCRTFAKLCVLVGVPFFGFVIQITKSVPSMFIVMLVIGLLGFIPLSLVKRVSKKVETESGNSIAL